MKYFTKYLPVEGEIKEGDWIRDKLSGDIGQVRKWEIHINEQKDFEKVKLFLCSRDIEVGDKFLKDGDKLSEQSEVNDESILYHINNANKLKPNTYFKVIGEISPEAIWVKEGDKFTDDQVRLYRPKNTYKILYKVSEIIQESWHVFAVAVLNPTCKHFY